MKRGIRKKVYLISWHDAIQNDYLVQQLVDNVDIAQVMIPIDNSP
jgi:hypothetical protein